MKLLYIPVLASVFLLAGTGRSVAQEDSGPLTLKLNRIVYNPGSNYAVYIPTFEFHFMLEKDMMHIRSSVYADYNYHNQDMGFGMSHMLKRPMINPGITVEDNLYFRDVFSDSTGVWKRKQSVEPFLLHNLTNRTRIGIQFKLERELSPLRAQSSRVITSRDRSVKLFHIYQKGNNDLWDHRLFYISFERSFRILDGDFNYLLMETIGRASTRFNESLRVKWMGSWRGNLTPRNSPIYFMGGHSSLIGYARDEFWGRRVWFSQTLFEYSPFPDFVFRRGDIVIRTPALLYRFDIGRVRGIPFLHDVRLSDTNIKTSSGFGIGINTDIPWMPSTDIHFMIGFPHEKATDLKFYAGFGAW